MASTDPTPGTDAPPRARPPAKSKLVSRLVLGLALGIATFLLYGFFGDFRALGDRLAAFPPGLVAPVLALSLVNYGLRALRWDAYLRLAGVRVKPGLSAGVFASGLAMSVTPGKLGEVIKVGLLHEAVSAPVAATFPVVVTERLMDLLSVLALAAIGVLRDSGNLDVLAGGVALTAVMFALLATRPGTRLTFRAAGVLLRRNVPTALADEAAAVQGRLLRPLPLAGGVLAGAVAWFAEAAGLYLVVVGLGGDVGIGTATAIYAVGTLAGALSFLPGGLIATEGMLAVLLAGTAFSALAGDEAGAAAFAATTICRLATLWFAVGLGVVGLLWTRGHLRRSVPPSGS
ncbi:MAG: flippase-like domain-containing protein [Deltaproteobacteria bacterium]|nr:flippase-like domain-containing protein [Deltaproteobacteria bacterium]